MSGSAPRAFARGQGAFEAARHSIRARALLTAFAIFLVTTSVVIVLWVGAQDVLSDRFTPAGSAN